MSKAFLQVTDRVLRVLASAVATAPAAQTEPHFVQSPTIEGIPTRGFGLALVAPDSASPNAAATAIAAGFTVTVYRLIPSLGIYAAGMSKTAVPYQQQLVNFDMGGAQAFYFVIAAASVAVDGDLLLCFTELP
jgi:hypothetical protein